MVSIKEPLKRVFYEIEAIKGNWSVRELKRQINSLYYERSGLSKKPEKLAEIAQSKIQPARSHDIVKNVYAKESISPYEILKSTFKAESPSFKLINDV